MGLLPFPGKNSPTHSSAGSNPARRRIHRASTAASADDAAAAPPTRRRRAAWRPLSGLFVLAGILMLSALGCDADAPQSLFSANGPVAREQLLLFNVLLWTMVAVFVLVEGALLYAAVRFRRKPNDPLPPQTHGNTPLEITWTIVPTILILGLGIWSVFVLFKLEPDEAIAIALAQGKEPVRVEAIGHQWWWEFRYENADGNGKVVTTGNEMRIPINTPIIMELKSNDVIHSFWIPKLAGKQDVVPTRTNEMWFLAEDPGMYHGQCAELCGTAHAQMKFRVHALEEPEYAAWIDGWGTPPQLSASAQAGQLVFLGDGQCVTCHTVGAADTVDENGDGVQSGRRQTFLTYQQWKAKPDDEKIADIRTGNEPPTAFAAPNLTDLGQRTTIAAAWIPLNRENLRQWIRDPDSIKPGNRMSELAPIYQTRLDHHADLSEQQLGDLVEYLMAQGVNPDAAMAGR